MVAEEISTMQVCDEHIAKASIKDFPNLDINTDISFTQFYAWGVGNMPPSCWTVSTVWLDTYTESKEYKQLYNKILQLKTYTNDDDEFKESSLGDLSVVEK